MNHCRRRPRWYQSRVSDSQKLPRTFWWLWAGGLLSALANFVFPFLALYLKARDFSPGATGLLVSLYGGGTVAAGPLIGHLADRHGRRPALLGALITAGALAILVGFLEQPIAVATAVILLGLATNAFRPASSAIIVDLVPAELQTRAFGLVYWANNLGGAVSLGLGGLLASSGYSRLFIADGATTLLFASLVFQRVPESRPVAPTARDGVGAAADGGYRVVLADRTFLAFLALWLGFLLVLFQFLLAAPLDLTAHGLSTAEYGRVMMLNGILVITLQPLLTRLTARRPAGQLLAVATALTGLGFGAYGLCRGPLDYALATAVWSVGEVFAFPTAAALIGRCSKPGYRARYQGLYSLTFGVSLFVAPLVGSLGLHRLGSRGFWMLCGLFGLVVAAGHLVLGAALPKDAPAAAAPPQADDRVSSAS